MSKKSSIKHTIQLALAGTVMGIYVLLVKLWLNVVVVDDDAPYFLSPLHQDLMTLMLKLFWALYQTTGLTPQDWRCSPETGISYLWHWQPLVQWAFQWLSADVCRGYGRKSGQGERGIMAQVL